MFSTAKRVSSELAEKRESLDTARNIALSNGYSCSRFVRNRRSHRRIAQESTDAKIPFCIPFVSDEMSRAIRACLFRADLQESVRIVEIPPANLRQRLTRNRLYDHLCETPNCVVCPYGRAGDCLKSGVIYLIHCMACGSEYIGERGRPLCLRVKEHLAGMRRSKTHTPLGAHKVQSHGDSEFEVSVSILTLESEISARKALEALWILAKDPEMNRRDEQNSVTHELAPFIGLCRFDND